MPSKECLYKETVSVRRQVPVKKPTGRRFAAIPDDVLNRKDISASAKLVLGVLDMEAFGRGGIAISHQVIADKCGLSRPQALENIHSLEEVGLIAKDGDPVRQVQPYRFLHPRMARNETKRPLVTCSSCKAQCYGVSKSTGWCRSCTSKVAAKRKLLAAERALGPEATLEEKWAWIRNKDIPKPLVAANREIDAERRKAMTA